MSLTKAEQKRIAEIKKWLEKADRVRHLARWDEAEQIIGVSPVGGNVTLLKVVMHPDTHSVMKNARQDIWVLLKIIERLQGDY